MKKIQVLAAFAILLVFSGCSEAQYDYPFTIAHRGCWLSEDGQFTDSRTFAVTENSLEAVRMAARYGYKAIELDPRITSDGVIVVMHDRAINRTMVRADGSEIGEKVFVNEHTFDDLRSNYVLRSSIPGNRTQIPTLRELLETCRDCGVMPLMHCDFFDAYTVVKEILGDNFIAFGENFDVLRQVRGISPCKILLDPSREMRKRGLEETPENVLALLDEIGGDTGISSMKHAMCRPEMCEALKAAGHDVQSSIFRTPAELDAIRNGVTILLTDFGWCPSEGMKPVEFSRTKTAGEMDWTGKRIEYGALTVEMEGCGEWELDICGERNYSICRETSAREVVSLRYYDRAPSVSLNVKSGEVKVIVRNYAL